MGSGCSLSRLIREVDAARHVASVREGDGQRSPEIIAWRGRFLTASSSMMRRTPRGRAAHHPNRPNRPRPATTPRAARNPMMMQHIVMSRGGPLDDARRADARLAMWPIALSAASALTATTAIDAIVCSFARCSIRIHHVDIACFLAKITSCNGCNDAIGCGLLMLMNGQITVIGHVVTPRFTPVCNRTSRNGSHHTSKTSSGRLAGRV
jgi:hypothetical protein